ncbi:MAG: tRNA lysidine(34) synthetase TilS [Proteobacteria bacterium]|nr:tRNA lysidine(34) synthetase TilS [Pseudomonadota bacterium]
MASSRSSTPADLPAALAAAVPRGFGPGTRIVAGHSGGRDSTALLHALAPLARARGWTLVAVHVHHGLSPEADAWAAHSQASAAALSVVHAIVPVRVARGAAESLEENARAARHAALAAAARAHGAGIIALAHHADDQAETLLLQLGRGAGPHGLAAMAPLRHADGLAWWRPLLAVPRAAVDAYVATHALRHVEDASNASTRHRRNALRLDVIPALRATLPGYPQTLVRSAALQAEAAALLDELAALDAAAHVHDGALAVAGLAALPAPRARNLLRAFLRDHGLRAPSAARLGAMLAQFAAAPADSRASVAHDGARVSVYRGHVHVHAPGPPAFAAAWHGEPVLALPHGALEFAHAPADAGDACLAPAALATDAVSVRSRAGGERLVLRRGGPRQSVKTLLQNARLPAWERAALPFVFCGDRLAAVPGIGVDAAFRAAPGAPGIHLTWRPGTRARRAD